MALKHYTGPKLPDDPTVSPPPSAPVPPVPPVLPPAVQALPSGSAPRGFPPEYQGVVVTIQGTEPGGIEVIGVGPTVEDAIRVAHAKWEAAHVQPLVWADGSAVEGLAKAVLVQSLELMEQLGGLEVEARVMLGQLKGALGEDTGGEQ